MKIVTIGAIAAIAVCAIGVYPTSLHAQTKKEDKTKNEQPLELPEFVITGVEAIDVPGGTKQTPRTAARLTQNDLDRFNSLEKQTPRMLPAPRMPLLTLPSQQSNGFVRGEFGLFTSPVVDVGYHLTAGDFDLYARGGGAFSNGHVTNAGFTDFHADLDASYIAPEKFFFFGGSKTDSYIRFGRRGYKLYGVDGSAEAVPERSTVEFGGGVRTVGGFENVGYDMGISVETMNLSQNGTSPNLAVSGNASASNNLISAHLGLKAGSESFKLGGRVNADIQSYRNNNMYFVQPMVTINLNSGTVLAALEVGGQFTQNSASESQTGFMANARLEYFASSALTLRGSFATGLQPNAFQTMLRENPYLSDSASIRYSNTLVNAGLQAIVHPTTALQISVGGQFKVVSALPVFHAEGSLNKTNPPTFVPSGSFYTWYVDATISQFQAEMLWRLSEADAITVQGQYSSALLRNLVGVAEQPSVPYTPKIQASLSYRRYWASAFSTTFDAVYIGERKVVDDSQQTLGGYADLRFAAEYIFSDRLSAFMRFTNLLDQKVYVWQGYIERGRFGALGVTVKF